MSDSASNDEPKIIAARDAEFEWLLCLASALLANPAKQGGEQQHPPDKHEALLLNMDAVGQQGHGPRAWGTALRKMLGM